MIRRMASSAVAFTTQTTPGFRCGYHDGMFSNGAPDKLQRVNQFDALKYHEAGHSVLSYALGDCVRRIELYEDVRLEDGQVRSRVSGFSADHRKVRLQIARCILHGVLNERVINYVVGTTAGPAAERKWNLLEGIVPHQLGVTDDDHKMVSMIRDSLCRDLDPYFDIEGEAWRRAQDALEIDVIWEAVQYLAGCLSVPEKRDEPGLHVKVFPGSKIRSVLRERGVRLGMLATFWPPFETRKSPRLPVTAVQP